MQTHPVGSWGCTAGAAYLAALLNTPACAVLSIFDLHSLVLMQSAAKKEFVLSDRDLARLGSLKKRNPQHPDWQPMLLYLKSQVEQVSRNLHGSVESAQEAKRARDQERLEQKIKVGQVC